MSRINGIPNIVLPNLRSLIALHETFNDLMLYKDVSELKDLSYGYVNLVSELRGYLLTLTTSVALRVRIRKLRLTETFSVLQDETFTGRLTGIFMPSPAVCVIMSPLHCRVKRSAMQSLPDQLRCFGGTHIEASSLLRVAGKLSYTSERDGVEQSSSSKDAS